MRIQRKDFLLKCKNVLQFFVDLPTSHSSVFPFPNISFFQSASLSYQEIWNESKLQNDFGHFFTQPLDLALHPNPVLM